MTGPITIRLAGKPVPKGRPRIGKSRDGRPVAFTPTHTRKYEAVLKLQAQRAMNGTPPLTGPLHATIIAELPIPVSWSKKKQAAARANEIAPTKRPDLDNYAKIAADALNGVVFQDDCQIVALVVRKRYSDAPALSIMIEQTGAEAS